MGEKLPHNILTKIEIGPNIRAIIPKDVVNYYYSLIPKYLCPLRVGHPPHITIVREFEPVDREKVSYLSGKEIVFSYSGADEIELVGAHFVIKAYSEEAQSIRVSLGLPPLRVGFNCFHFTIGYIE